MKKLRIISWAIIGFFSLVTIVSIMSGKLPKNDSIETKTEAKIENKTENKNKEHASVEKVDNEDVAAPVPEETTTTQETDTLESTETTTEETTEQPTIEETTIKSPVEATTNKKCVWGDFEITEAEYKLICTTVFCESGNESLQTQILVCLTILNRYSAGYASSIRGVIYAKNAYSVTGWKDFENRGWTDQVEQAVNIALEKNEHPRDMFYFRDDYFHPGNWAKDYIKSGTMYFSTRAN